MAKKTTRTAKFRILHPRSGEQVHADFLVAQGDGDKAITHLVGTILDRAGHVVATGTMLKPPPHWLIVFHNILPGQDYRLEVRDATTTYLLACVGPIDAVKVRPFDPQIFYPAFGASVGQIFSSYGQTGSNAVEGQVSSPGPVTTAWIQQTQGPPNWIVSFSGIPIDNTGSTTMIVRDTVTLVGNPANNLIVIQ